MAKVSKCRLCFGTGLRQFRYTYEASISSLEQLNDTVLCVRVYASVESFERIREKRENSKKRGRGRGRNLFQTQTEIQSRFAVDDAEEIREGKASLQEEDKREKNKKSTRLTLLACSWVDRS